MATISLCSNPNLKHTKLIEYLSIFVVSGKDIQAFIYVYKLCRAHEIICRAHEILCRAHEILPRAHDIICYSHEIISRAHDINISTQNIACPKYTTVEYTEKM